MAKLQDLLTDHKNSGVYLLKPSIPVAAIKEMAEENKLGFFKIEGDGITNKGEFLKQVADSLRFPDYFGNNWDALADCLTDMEWHKTTGFIIIYDNFRPFAEHERDEFEIALEIFEESAEFWGNHGKLMIVLISGSSEYAKELPEISL